MARTKGGLSSKLHLAANAHGMPVRLILTKGTTADCTQARALMEDLPDEYLAADRGYDTNAVLAKAKGAEPVIPPKSNRKEPQEYVRDLYKLRHLVENAFLSFNQWRGVATRHAKRAASFLAICQIRALVIWTKLF